MRRARPGLVDVSGAALLFVGALLELLLSDEPAPAGATAVAVTATTIPLVWRSAYPVATVMITTSGLLVAVLLGFPAGDFMIPYLAPLVALYSVGLRSSRRGILVAAAFALASFTLGVVESSTEGGAELSYVVIGIVAALAVGLAVRQLGFETDTLAARAAEAERTRDESARAAVAAERARIARELHDVIGHSISVMGVQAGAVRRVLPPELEREREALLGVERVGRDAVTEMRRLLGLLRPAEGLDESAPTPTLERLDDLVADVRRAGLAVDLEIEGELGDLTAGRALAAYRVLQEALTNALRHAPGSHVRVLLRRSPDELVIEVRDDGANGAAAPSEGGYGLVGMRERLALYGGTLAAGPQPGRGYAIVARLPTADS